VLARSHREVKAVAVEHPGGHGHLEHMVHPDGPAPIAVPAQFGPRLTATAAPMTRETHGDLEGHRDTATRLIAREANRRGPAGGRLVDADLSRLASTCEEYDDAFVMFNTLSMASDAARFRVLLEARAAH